MNTISSLITILAMLSAEAGIPEVTTIKLWQGDEITTVSWFNNAIWLIIINDTLPKHFFLKRNKFVISLLNKALSEFSKLTKAKKKK